MLKLHTHRYIRFATVERETAYVVVAVLFEQRGMETVALTEPRIVRVIPKKTAYALNGSTSNGIYITGPQRDFSYSAPFISPYTDLFHPQNSDSIVWFSARPPTFA